MKPQLQHQEVSNLFFATLCAFSKNSEQFSNDCRKASTKVITPINHKRNQSELLAPCSKRRKNRTRCDWFWFCFSLVEEFKANDQMHNRNRVITFDSHLKTVFYARVLMKQGFGALSIIKVTSVAFSHAGPICIGSSIVSRCIWDKSRKYCLRSF